MMTHHRLVFAAIKVVQWRGQVTILESEGKTLKNCKDCCHPTIKAEFKSWEKRMATAIRKRNNWESEVFAIMNEDGGHEQNLMERDVDSQFNGDIVEPTPTPTPADPAQLRRRSDGKTIAVRRPLSNIVRGSGGLTRG